MFSMLLLLRIIIDFFFLGLVFQEISQGLIENVQEIDKSAWIIEDFVILDYMRSNRIGFLANEFLVKLSFCCVGIQKDRCNFEMEKFLFYFGVK